MVFIPDNKKFTFKQINSVNWSEKKFQQNGFSQIYRY